MLSVANSFDAEMQFRFVFDGNRLQHKYIDFRHRFGNDIGLRLQLGYELESLEVKKSITDLVTGLKPTGGTPEGTETPINLTKLSKAYDDGDIYTSGAYVFSRSARAKWNRYNSDYGGDGNLIRAWSYDTTNVDELLKRSITHLKANMDEKKSYTAQISDSVKNIGLGDIITAIDKSRDIRVRCRVTETEETTAGMSYTLEEVLG